MLPPYHAADFTVPTSALKFAIRNSQFVIKRLRLFLVAAFIAVTVLTFIVFVVQAASATWNSSPTNSNWVAGGSDNNWSTGTGTFPGATSGLTNTDTATFTGASTQLSITINSTTLNVKSITFSGSSEPAYTIGSTSGNSLFLTNAGTISIASTTTGASITNAVNAPLVLEPASSSTSGSYTFSNASSTASHPLVIGGTVTGGTTSQGIALTLTGANAGANTVSGVISDGGASGGLAITKTSSGTWTFSGSNSYTGGTTITAGAVTFGAAGVLADAGAITLSGGTLKSGATTGFTETVGTLTLSDNSTIALGTGSHTLTFAASNGVSWTSGKKLTITGWAGGFNGTPGTAGRIFVGSSSSGLTANQLAQIVFSNGTSNYPATILSTGEVAASIATFYSKSTGNLDVLSTWGTATDGSGTSPTDFTSADQIFNIRNNPTPTIGAAWTVSGSGSKVILGDASVAAINFTVPSSFAFNSTIDIAAASSGSNTLTLQNSTITTFGTLDSGSTVDYDSSGSQTISAANYGNLTSTNTGARTLASSGTIGVKSSFSPGSNSYTNTGSTIDYNGSSAQTGPAVVFIYNNLTISNSAGLTLAASQTVDGTLSLTGDITTGSFTVLMGTGSTSAGTGDVVGSVNRGDLNGGTARSFGNPDVKVTETAGTVNDMTITLKKGVTPNDFTNSVKRVYTITPNNGVNLVATVRLHYLDGELNGNSEATLDLWRKNSVTGTWQDQLETTRNDDTSGDQNWVELSGVSQFSDWTLANNNIVPTSVDAVLMKATRYNKRVLLEWQTGYEVNNVGFNLYRENNGSLDRITPEPVAGSALIAGPGVVLRNGFAYSWWDDASAACGLKADDCQNVRYWVEDISINSGTTLHGPFGVEQAPPDQAPPPGKGRLSLLSALGRDVSMRGTSTPVERKATVIKPTAALLSAQSSLAGQTAVKLSVQHEGWYRVDLADLRAAGFPAGIDPNMIQLFADGQQVPIIVTTGDPKPSWTGIEFYGIGIDSAFTANHVYWLVAGSQQGARISSAAVDDGMPAPSTFTYAVERRDKVVYFPALKNGGGEKFFGPLIFNAQPADQSVVARHIAANGGNAMLEVSIQGFTATPHSVRVLFNGSELGTIQFNGLAKGTAQYSIAQGSLKEGSNQIQLISPTGFTDISMSEYVRLTYAHTNDADGNSLRLPASGGQQVTINGFTDPNVRMIDVTTTGSPQELLGTITNNGTTFSISANVPGTGAKTLLAFAPDQQQRPASIAANQPSNWRDPSQAGDYLVFTRKDLIASLGPLVSHRHDQGLTPAVVDIEDVYDEFSFGNKTPQALKDFIVYAKSNWAKPPRFVVLAGDATYDPKNYTGAGDNDLVPTRLVETAFNETATDDWFVDVNDDGLPDIPVGRLPVRTPDEAASLVAKIVGYDDTTRIKSVLLVADANSGFDFEAADTQLQSVIPKKISVTDIRRAQLGDADARSLLLDAINQGQRLVNYYGHGSVLIWSSAPLLRASDAAGFVNQNHLSLFVAMTCLSGFFQDVSIDSMGESLLKAPAGAVAVWASSGLTDPNSQVVMNQWAIKQLLGPLGTKSTIGEHVMRAKAVVSDLDVRRTWILLGDPATRLK
jgi:autotransporter-associated beta strand protein